MQQELLLLLFEGVNNIKIIHVYETKARTHTRERTRTRRLNWSNTNGVNLKAVVEGRRAEREIVVIFSQVFFFVYNNYDRLFFRSAFNCRLLLSILFFFLFYNLFKVFGYFLQKHLSFILLSFAE